MKAIWDISNICNLKCKYCGADYYEKNKLSLSLEDTKKIIHNIKGCVDEIDLFGGEPLLIKDIDLIIKELSECKIRTNITTNGQNGVEILNYMMTEKILLGSLAVSIDGNETDTDLLRGKGTYQRAIEFLKRAISLKENNKLSWMIGVSAVVTQVNVEHILVSIDEWIKMGVDFINQIFGAS